MQHCPLAMRSPLCVFASDITLVRIFFCSFHFGHIFKFLTFASNFDLVLQSYFCPFYLVLHIFVRLLHNSSSKSLVKILKNTGRISSELYLRRPSG